MTMNKPVPRKNDGGALMFWTWFNTLQERFDQLEASYLRVARANGEMKRRLDVLEETVKLHGQMIFKEEPLVRFTCISCDHTFDLSLPEARMQNFTSVCHVCHNWALPLCEGHQYSLREIADLTGYAYETTCQAVREMRLRPRGKGKPKKLFNEQEFKKIETVLLEKTPRGNNGKGNRKIDTRAS